MLPCTFPCKLPMDLYFKTESLKINPAQESVSSWLIQAGVTLAQEDGGVSMRDGLRGLERVCVGSILWKSLAHS